MENSKDLKETLSWSVFIGSMFIGWALGMLFGNEGAGMFAGLGVGFISSAIVERSDKK